MTRSEILTRKISLVQARIRKIRIAMANHMINNVFEPTEKIDQIFMDYTSYLLESNAELDLWERELSKARVPYHERIVWFLIGIFSLVFIVFLLNQLVWMRS